MFTISRIETYSQEIKKSRFLAIAAPVTSEQAAKDFLQRHSDPTATHNCWAWRMGQNYRFNDAGEPAGTAGKPMLAAIDGQKVDNVVVLVTRWFGGILLGAGGLMRAYGGTAATCLRLAEKTEIIPMIGFALACDFSDHALLKARLNAVENLAIAQENFTGTGVEIAGVMPIAVQEDVARLVTDLTRGKSVIAFDE
ncbi:putative YigZ family protein [Ochrobactrum daejeonense]|uniref:Putative YigZ family protein n=1 Tax=Brucella daejeonensis TaxID=659015 RepID=A0A7W9AYC8_9HYPH|nr:YigZ family protein [Brucella daejeonensis]MBB5702878.1 putative YigZ family protein [Brucella daejeonensis]NKB79632.1 YigZ family protein [Brucella daejeonensis]